MKKFFTFVSAALLAFSLQAAETIEVDGIYYQLNNDQTATLLPAQAPATIYDQESIVIPVAVSKDEVEYPVVAIAKAAFRNSTASSITFAKGSQVTELGMQAFQAAVNVQELELPEGVKLIPMTCIHNATATNPMTMKKLVLPSTVDSLAIFSICLPQLQTLEFKGAVPPRIATRVTATWTQNPWQISTTDPNNTNKGAIVIVPEGAVEAYRNTEWIGDYFTIITDVRKDTVLVDGLYYEMDNVEHKATIIPAQNDAKKYEQESIVIPAFVSEGGREFPVVALAKAAFRLSTASSITFAEGSNVIEIGMQAFQRVTNITELVLPEGVELIPVTCIHSDQDPATEPMALEKLVLPASVDSLAMMSVVAPKLTTLEFKGAVPPGCCRKYIAATDYYQVPWQINAAKNDIGLLTKPECVIIVPKGALEAYQAAPGIGDYFTTIQEAEDTATAVENVSSNNAFRSGVYTITGCYLGEDATNLPKGMYIINGQKVIR